MNSRSSLLLWLLLIATLSVTAVVSMWMLDEGLDKSTATLYLGLTFGELSVLCAAIVRSHDGFRSAWVLPFLLGFLAAFVMAVADGFPREGWEQFAVPVDSTSIDVDEPQVESMENTPNGRERWEPLISFTAIFWLHAAAILLALWMLRPTALFARFSNLPPGNRWQFSLMHLLILMTCVALLCMTLTRAVRILEGDGTILSTATLPLANCLLMLAVLWATQSAHHFLARLSLSMSAAMVIAAVCGIADLAFADELNIVVYALLQALVMWAWFELMRHAPEAAQVAGKV